MTTPPPNTVKHYLYDEKQRKILPKDSLLATREPTDQIQSTQDSSWTQLGWHKAGSVHRPVKGKGQKTWGNQKMQKLQPNKVQKRLEEALAKPVQLTKAESMMKKMGWQGGALGKEGTGIVEPVAPNAAYALKTLGFGQASHTPDPRPLPKKARQKLSRQKAQQLKQLQKAQSNLGKETFQTNILHQILEFVKNDYEIEIVFDKHLFKNERKVVHRLVNDVINGDEMTSLGSMDLVETIREHNHYVLCTESQGVFPDRALCLFKEPPEHVYLITPKDLRDKSEEDEECEKPEENKLNNQTNDVHDEVMIEEINNTCNEVINKSINVTESEKTVQTKLEGLNTNSDDLTHMKNSGENLNKELKDTGEITEDKKDITMKDIIATETNEKVNKDSSNDLKETLNENVDTDLLPDSDLNDVLTADVNSDANSKEDTSNTDSDLNDVLTADVSSDANSKEDTSNTDSDGKINKDIENQHINVPEKLIEYLKEFADTEDYSEMRFLGPFSIEEMNSINNLVSNMYYHVNHNVDKVEKLYEEVFKEFDEERYIFEVKEDINGSPVIHKTDTYKGKRKSSKNHVYFDTEELCEDVT